jgi:Putative peptidoglycan binding domain
MTVYLLGSRGPEVLQIQQRLSELQFYSGPADGVFGGGTDSAVRAFQLSKQLTVDGRVGPGTWGALFNGADAPAPAVTTQSLDLQCLALTGGFETNHPPPDCFAGLSGDFDDQGISFGVLQWNIGQGSLQPLLTQMNQNHPDLLGQVFGPNYSALVAMLGESRDEQLVWARSIQDPMRHVLFEPWQGQFKTLGRLQEFQDIEAQSAAGIFQLALGLCNELGVSSQRAAALLFDIKVQSGGIKSWVKPQILSDFEQLDQSGAGDVPLEVARLRIIATRSAASANPKWVADVQNRKLTIANGEGTVHGNHYDLEAQYGITLNSALR